MSKFRLIAAVLFALFFASSVYAADIAVDADCSLADAIIAANRDRAEGNCPAGRGADIIILSQDITLDGNMPKITSDITIEGNGYTISGNNRYRIFYNDGGALTINDLTMTNGYVEGELIRDEDGTLKVMTVNSIGGAIYNRDGELSVSGSAFSDNSTEYNGGAIYNDGELSISDSAFSDNLADEDGGAIYNEEGTLSISDSNFSDNLADEDGGAIYNDGELSISDSTFSNNLADEDGGAIYNEEGTLSISDSIFSDNLAEGSLMGTSGGAIYNGAGTVTISDSAFSGNLADRGGAIYNDEELSISGSTFSDNVDGAIYNWGGELSISSSSFSNNSGFTGGAIANSFGELSISGSAFSGNSAESNLMGTSGGAISNYKELIIVSSTFSNNSADKGGAIANGDDGKLRITNSTFSNNSADKGGAIANGEDGRLRITNSIIAGNGGNACYSSSRLRHNINNFIQDGSCSSDFSGDPMLGALVVPEDGSPAYFPLLAGSPAIDAADDAYCPETDQIGTTRPQGTACDIGAIEYVSP